MEEERLPEECGAHDDPAFDPPTVDAGKLAPFDMTVEVTGIPADDSTLVLQVTALVVYLILTPHATCRDHAEIVSKGELCTLGHH